MDSMPATPDTALSITSVISVSMTCGDAPWYRVVTVTTLESTSGSSRIGIDLSAANPAVTINKLATIVVTGRRIARSDKDLPCVAINPLLRDCVGDRWEEVRMRFSARSQARCLCRRRYRETRVFLPWRRDALSEGLVSQHPRPL